MAITISVIVYYRWLSFNYFGYADNLFFYYEQLSEGIIPSTWLSDHTAGHPNIVIWNIPFVKWIPSIVSFIFEVDSNVTEKIHKFWPVVFLLPSGSFFLVKHLTKSDIAGLIGSIVFCFNTYFLSINSQGHLSLTVACAFANFAFLFFIKSLEKLSISYSIITSLTFFIVGSYDFRFLYILSYILFAYTIFYVFFVAKIKVKNYKESAKYFLLALTPYLLYILMAAYWVIPTLVSGEIIDNQVLRREIIFRDYWGIFEAMTLSHTFWGNLPIWSTPTNYVNMYYFAIPILAALGYYINKKNQIYTFFLVFSIIGILLSKQNGVPFEWFYDWMFENFPGFKAFREATKFYYIIAISYAVLIGGLSKSIWEIKSWKKINKNRLILVKTAALLSISSVFLVNTYGILTGSIGSLYTPKEKQIEYELLNNYLNDNSENYRTFLVARDSLWMPYSTKIPKYYLSRVVGMDGWNNLDNYDKISGKPFVDILFQDFSNNLLDYYSTKYVILPIIENESYNDDFSFHFRIGRDYYVDLMKEIDYLKKIDINAGDIIVYENEDPLPRVYLSDKQVSLNNRPEYEEVNFVQITQYKYKVEINNLSKKTYLNFTDTYHSSWKARIGNDFNWFDSIIKKNYFLPDSFHFSNDHYLNYFVIDPNYIRNNYSLEEYSENPDGSINMNIYLYYQPQAYFYVGTIFTFSVIFILFSSLIYINRHYSIRGYYDWFKKY